LKYFCGVCCNLHVFSGLSRIFLSLWIICFIWKRLVLLSFVCLFEDKKFLIFMPFDVLQPLFLLKSPQK